MFLQLELKITQIFVFIIFIWRPKSAEDLDIAKRQAEKIQLNSIQNLTYVVLKTGREQAVGDVVGRTVDTVADDSALTSSSSLSLPPSASDITQVSMEVLDARPLQVTVLRYVGSS